MGPSYLASPEELSVICKARDRISLALGSSVRKVGKLELIRENPIKINYFEKSKKGHKIVLKDIDFRRAGTVLTHLSGKK